MARDIFGNKKVTREDRYTKKSTKYSNYSSSDIRWEQFKIFIYILLGYIYFHFIVMGWTI